MSWIDDLSTAWKREYPELDTPISDVPPDAGLGLPILRVAIKSVGRNEEMVPASGMCDRTRARWLPFRLASR